MEQIEETEINLFGETLPSLEQIKEMSGNIHSSERI